MKIKMIKLEKPPTIDEFADQYNLTMIVKEREPLSASDPYRWEAYFEGASNLSKGLGSSPSYAIESYTQQIVNLRLVFPGNRAIHTPKEFTIPSGRHIERIITSCE